MSNQDGFAGGLLTGALLGGLVGGIIGAALGSRAAQKNVPDDRRIGGSDRRDRTDRLPRKSPRQLHNEEDMETARQMLEVKIAQLNEAIDDVREQLHSVNGSSTSSAIDDERSLAG
jgi:hypothetical protein